MFVYSGILLCLRPVEDKWTTHLRTQVDELIVLPWHQIKDSDALGEAGGGEK
jgi:hypothetical protein